ncbi:hypothetical protein HID58_065242, partial [Brassica napus]
RRGRDNAACSYSEISMPSWGFGEKFATRYESVRQRTKVGLIDVVARKTQQLSDLNYESHIGKRFLVDTKGITRTECQPASFRTHFQPQVVFLNGRSRNL